MRSSRFFAVFVFGLAIFASQDSHKIVADEVDPLAVTPAKPDQPITLRDRLVVGLQARLKSEVDFCDNVADRVNSGKLPERLVDETFFWARQRAASIRNGHKYRPIVYFQPGLRARADKLHLSLD
ncbi:MAG TPA: hypothetical protein VH107_21015 [Lacipirellulaceae bacterium]|jgi:hypothetical protein|nr:hypothetical protein [Lacipirellulaceae bacterium]